MAIISFSTSAGNRSYSSVDELIKSVEDWLKVDDACQANVTVSEHYVAIEYIHDEADSDTVEMIHRSYLTAEDVCQIQDRLV